VDTALHENSNQESYANQALLTRAGEAHSRVCVETPNNGVEDIAYQHVWHLLVEEHKTSLAQPGARNVEVIVDSPGITCNVVCIETPHVPTPPANAGLCIDASRARAHLILADKVEQVLEFALFRRPQPTRVPPPDPQH
jgi:hypothetical protein